MGKWILGHDVVHRGLRHSPCVMVTVVLLIPFEHRNTFAAHRFENVCNVPLANETHTGSNTDSWNAGQNWGQIFGHCPEEMLTERLTPLMVMETATLAFAVRTAVALTSPF
jgi:hypothetical protein